MLNSLVDSIIDEIKYSGLTRKQKTITNLFPQFPSRVKAIAGMGGLRLYKVEPDLWHFKVHSGTKDDVWYDDYVRFKNIDEILRKHIKDRNLWNKTGTHVLLPRLAREVLFDTDIQLSCSCPAQKFWGHDYILSLNKYNAKYGKPETRPPKIRNPRQYGAYCKHLQNVINVLPWYESTMAKYLKQFYLEDIRRYEQDVLKKTKAKESRIREDGFDDIFKPASKEELYKRKKERIERVLRKQGCTLNPDGTYSCEGDVIFYGMNLTRLYVRFKEVKGRFDCSLNDLITLEGAPERVGKMFNCSRNKLVTLEGGPEKVGGYFDCSHNELETLKGAPEIVEEAFYCSRNKLVMLEGGPEKVGGYFYCSRNKLVTLEGAPREVGGNFNCSFNDLTSLKGAPRKIGGSFECCNNRLTTLKGAPEKIEGYVYIRGNPIAELLGVEGFKGSELQYYSWME